MWSRITNKESFYRRANERLAKEETPKPKDNTQKLKELKELLDSGVITKKEFEDKKKELLRGI